MMKKKKKKTAVSRVYACLHLKTTIAIVPSAEEELETVPSTTIVSPCCMRVAQLPPFVAVRSLDAFPTPAVLLRVVDAVSFRV